MKTNKFNYKINPDLIKYNKTKSINKHDILYDIYGLDIDKKLIDNIILHFQTWNYQLYIFIDFL